MKASAGRVEIDRRRGEAADRVHDEGCGDGGLGEFGDRLQRAGRGLAVHDRDAGEAGRVDRLRVVDLAPVEFVAHDLAAARFRDLCEALGECAVDECKGRVRAAARGCRLPSWPWPTRRPRGPAAWFRRALGVPAGVPERDPRTPRCGAESSAAASLAAPRGAPRTGRAERSGRMRASRKVSQCGTRWPSSTSTGRSSTRCR